MQAPDFQQSIDIRTPLAQVYTYYAQLEHQQELHPLIHSVKIISESGAGATPRTVRYEIEEKVPFLGIFKVFNRYTVQMQETNPPHELMFDAYSKPNVHLHSVVRFTQTSPEIVRVAEEVTVGAPALLKSFVIKTAYQAHAKMLAKLKEVMESRNA